MTISADEIRWGVDDHAEDEAAIEKAARAERIRREARRRVDAEEQAGVVVPALERLRDRLAIPVSPISWRIRDLNRRAHGSW
jgi:hypothetical protein